MRWLKALIPALLLVFVGPAMAEKQRGGMNMGGDMDGGHMMQGEGMGNGGMMNMPMMRDHMKEMQQHMRQMSETKNPEKRMEQMQTHMKKMQRHMEMMQHMMEMMHGDDNQGGMMKNRQGGVTAKATGMREAQSGGAVFQPLFLYRLAVSPFRSGAREKRITQQSRAHGGFAGSGSTSEGDRHVYA